MKGKKAIASKFPTARIKKIMQEDEEIGKVAQGTPIVISRALELLLKDIIVETADIARTSGSKKLQPWHVKRLVAQNRQYDFLDDLVEAVADPTAGAESGIQASTSETKPNGRGKGRANGAKASPALKPNASTPPSSATPAAISPDSGARAPVMSSVVGVIGGPVGMAPITTSQHHTAYGSGKGPSNASVILNSPTAPGPGPMGSSSVKPAAKPEHDFDDYDEEDDDEDDDYDA